MSQIVIIADDGLVGIDNSFRPVDLTALDPTIWAVHWDTDTLTGTLERRTVPVNEIILDFSPYQQFADAWAVGPPADTRAEANFNDLPGLLGLLQLTMAITFTIENQVRVLQGNPTLTRTQFINAIDNNLGVSVDPAIIAVLKSKLD